MLTWLYEQAFVPLLLSLALCAWKWGQWPERTATALFSAAWLGTLLAKPAVHVRFFYVEAGVLLVDGALLIALGWLAVRTGRGWLIWATAFQLLSTTAHLGRAMDSSFSALGYSIMEGASSYPTLIALAVGLWQHRRS